MMSFLDRLKKNMKTLMTMVQTGDFLNTEQECDVWQV
jgi:hypothetical protein